MRTIKEISAQKKKYQEDFSENAKISGKIIFKNDPEENRGGVYRKYNIIFLRYKLGFLIFYFLSLI